MRADARRNRNAVLEAGARLLAERPTASMQEIADASGVGRTTVYRHFPAREDLVTALVAQVVEETVSVTGHVLSLDGTAPEALRRFGAEILALGGRWRFLRAQREEITASLQESDRAFLEWVSAAQRKGELRADLEPQWILAATRGILLAAADEVDRVGTDEAGRLAGETLVSCFTPR